MFERPSYEHLWALLDTATSGLWRWEIAQDHVEWSEGMFSFLGDAASETPGTFTRILDQLHPEDRHLLDAHVQSLLTGAADTYEVRVRIRSVSGAYKWMDARGLVVRDDAGEPVEMLGYAKDVTNLVHAAESSERRLRLVMDHCPAALYIKDPQGVHLYVNAAAAETAGTTPEAMVGQPTERLFDEETAGKLIDADQRVLKSRMVERWEGQIRNARGELRHVVDVKFPIEGNSPGELLVAGFGLDVTERVRREEELRRFEKRMQEVQKLESLGLLAGGIAHDFNNLLVGVLGSAELALEETSETHPAHQALTLISASAHEASDLCDQLLSYAGGGPLNLVDSDVSQVVRELGSMLDASVDRAVSILYGLDPDLPRVTLDAVQLRQVLVNLVMNAGDALRGREGEIRVSTALVSAAEARRAKHDWTKGESEHVVRVRVEDDGIGIPSDVLDRVFDPFFTTKSEGYGLGLASSLGIIRQLAGAIEVRSEHGVGTVFDVFLPLAPRASGLHEQEMRVLVVDDEEMVRTVIVRMLRRMGWPAVTADNGHAALSLVQSAPHDFGLAIVDLTMPGMSGIEVFERLSELAPQLPVVLSSGYTDRGHEVGSAMSAAAGFLRKPYGMNEVREVVEAALKPRGR